MVNISLFKNFVPLGALLPADRAELAKHARVCVYQPGQIIFLRGESAQTVPFLVSGEIELFDGSQARIVRAGSPEARNALATGPRTMATATCLTTAQVLLVDREHLDLILTWSQTGGLQVTEFGGNAGSGVEDAQDWMTALLQNQAFHRIPPGNIAQLFACMKPARFEAGETIIQQGDRGDCYFIVTDGRVQVVRQDADGINEVELSVLGVGRGFGEEALLSGDPRNATVRALTDVTVMKIDAHDFERLLKAPVLAQITLEEVTSDHQLVDVRLPEEYARGHVPGAINLPLGRLRELAMQLDMRRACAVYCDSGRRSASATYLLCERGFDARLVVGGVPAELMTESCYWALTAEHPARTEEHESMPPTTLNAQISPLGGMDMLSRQEVSRLRDASHGGLHQLIRRCALAVLASGSTSDDPRALLDRYPDFDIQVHQQDRGIKLELIHAPAEAFVDGEIIRGISELLFAVVRDIAFVASDIQSGRFNLDESSGITNAVFEILRNARILRPHLDPNLVVCWGGHSIPREEYEYTKKVGYQLGLRRLDICTGCGPGAMKGPMKGATIGHAKQRRRNNRYIGITEPGIIAAESPNPIVNHLVIMPDIEKRLEAFVRIAHAIVIFPGGVGTAEEILYLLGILTHPANAGIPLPMILTGPSQSVAYFEQIDAFLKLALGPKIAEKYRIIIDDPVEVAAQVCAGIEQVRRHRIAEKDAFFFNWSLEIDDSLQRPFKPTHANMAGLTLHRDQPTHVLAAELRRAFSGIVAGNVKEEGIQAIEKHGPFEIHGEPEIMAALDRLLSAFVAQHRMKLPGGAAYQPCYRLVA